MKINKGLNKCLKRKDFKINFENIRKNIFFIFCYVFSIKKTDKYATKFITSKLISFHVDEGSKGPFFRFDFDGRTDKSERLNIEVCGKFEILNSDLKFQYYDYIFLNTLYLEVKQIPKNEQLLNEI